MGLHYRLVMDVVLSFGLQVAHLSHVSLLGSVDIAHQIIESHLLAFLVFAHLNVGLAVLSEIYVIGKDDIQPMSAISEL